LRPTKKKCVKPRKLYSKVFIDDCFICTLDNSKKSHRKFIHDLKANGTRQFRIDSFLNGASERTPPWFPSDEDSSNAN
jgi:hypothetical protein